MGFSEGSKVGDQVQTVSHLCPEEAGGYLLACVSS